MFSELFAAGRAAAIAAAKAIAEKTRLERAAATLREWCLTGAVPVAPLPANYQVREDFQFASLKKKLCTICGASAATVGCCYFRTPCKGVRKFAGLKCLRKMEAADLLEKGIVLRSHQQLLLDAAAEFEFWQSELCTPDRVNIVLDPEVQFRAASLYTTVKWYHAKQKPCSLEQWIRAASAFKQLGEPQLFIAEAGYPLRGWQQLPASLDAYELVLSIFVARANHVGHHSVLADFARASKVGNWLEELDSFSMPPPIHKICFSPKRFKAVCITPSFNLNEVANLMEAFEALSLNAKFVEPIVSYGDASLSSEVLVTKEVDKFFSFSALLQWLCSWWSWWKHEGSFLFASIAHHPLVPPLSFIPVCALAMGVNEADVVESFDVSKLPTTASFLRQVRDKKKTTGSGKVLAFGGDSKMSQAEEKEFRKSDIFSHLSFGDKLASNRWFRRWINPDGHYSEPLSEMTISSQCLRFPGLELNGDPKAQFVTLTRPLEKTIRRVLENGWVEYRAAACSLKVTSHVALGTNVRAVFIFQQANSTDPLESALSSAVVDLSKQRGAMLTLPMINLSLSYASIDFEAWRMLLQLQVTIVGGKGLREGVPILSIACVEFGELVPNTFTGITHERDSWNAILAHGDPERPTRFQSTLNVVETLEKDCTEDFDALNGITINPPLCLENKVVRTFDSKAKVVSRIPRSLSTRLTFREVGSGNCDAGVKPRMSVSESGIAMGIDDVETTVCFNKVTIPAEQKIGTILSIFDVMNDARSFNNRLYSKWLLQGYMDANLEVHWAGALNSFTGTSYYIACDAYERIPADTEVLNKDVFTQLPGWLVVTRDATTFSHVFNVREIVGHNFYVGKSSVAKLRFVVISASDSQLELSAASFATLIVHAVAVDMACDQFETESYLEYPIQGSSLAQLNWYMPVETMTAGELGNKSYGLSLGAPINNGEKAVYSHQAALLNHFLGYGGTVHAKIIITSSAFVNVCFNVYCYHTVASQAVQLQIPHTIAWSGKDFSFKIMSPFYSVPSRGNNQSFIHLWPLSGVEAPKEHASNVDLYLFIKGIDVDMRLTRAIDYSNTFAWFSVRAQQRLIVSTPLSFKLTNYFGDFTLSTTGLTVKNYKNPFSFLCAASGMHYGKVKVHFEFNLTHSVTLGNLRGRSIITTGAGDEGEAQHGNIRQYNMLDNHAVIPFEFSSFAGPTPSADLGTFNNWIIFNSNSWAQFESLAVSVEVLPGFRFYGKTCSPLV